MSVADIASAKQHLSAAIRHLFKATNNGEQGHPLNPVLFRVSDALTRLEHPDDYDD